MKIRTLLLRVHSCKDKTYLKVGDQNNYRLRVLWTRAFSPWLSRRQLREECFRVQRFTCSERLSGWRPMFVSAIIDLVAERSSPLSMMCPSCLRSWILWPGDQVLCLWFALRDCNWGFSGRVVTTKSCLRAGTDSRILRYADTKSCLRQALARAFGAMCHLLSKLWFASLRTREIAVFRVLSSSRIASIWLVTHCGIQGTPRSMPSEKFSGPKDGVSPTTPSYAAFTGSEHLTGDALRIQRTPCWRQPKLLTRMLELKLLRMTREIVWLDTMSSSWAASVWVATLPEFHGGLLSLVWKASLVWACLQEWAGSYSGLEWLRYWRFRIITEMTTRIKFRYSASCLFDNGTCSCFQSQRQTRFDSEHCSRVKAWHKYAMKSL